MAGRKSNNQSDMPRILTVEDIAKRTGLSSQAISSRMRTRASLLGPYRKLRGIYVFTPKQFERLCENWGKGWNAVRVHAAYREGREATDMNRRKAS